MLVACEDIETDEQTTPQTLVGFSTEQIAGSAVVERKDYKIQDNNLYVSYPNGHPLGYELNQHYLTQQGVTLDPIKVSHSTWYLLGKQVTVSDAGLSYQPANLVVGDNLTLAKQWTKIDISGQPVTRYLGDWIYAALPLSQQSLFEDYYNAVQQLENKFPQGSTCWVINKHISNKNYISFSSDGTAPIYVDSNITAPAAGTWGAVTWMRDEVTKLMKFMVSGTQYAGQYHHQSGMDEYVPPYAGKYCDFVNEKAANALIQTWENGS